MPAKKAMTTLSLTCGLSTACSFSLSVSGDKESSAVWITSIDNWTEDDPWMTDFPAEADMAVILDVQGPAIIKARTEANIGEQLMPEEWINLVSSSFYDTEVEDAFDIENHYEEWRLVSMRVTPCGPLGIRLDQEIDELCWPAVRLVWQPVVEDFQLAWGAYTDFYADDRAIHAIYPVHPRYSDGSRGPAEARDDVQGWLAQGGSPDNIPPEVMDQFRLSRNSTIIWLMSRLHDLREPSLPEGSWNELEVRPEIWDSDDIQFRFAQQLYTFLGEFAPNQDLDEMTSFSLPEGRDPGSADIWVFTGFHGNQGNPQLKNLEVIDRNSGELLINIGPSQSVAMAIEDPVVEEAIEAGNEALADSLIISNEDIDTKGDAMADPYQFLVPNTSCASCHRLNDLRFDFHSLSGFENNPITISPRVNKDVERDLNWARQRGF